jgi:predicted O-linked N-acetylglucosamine transferase (SPINDLY family)
LKERLARNRETTPLFDTPRLTRGLETAFVTMWERQQRGGAPETFDVPPA